MYFQCPLTPHFGLIMELQDITWEKQRHRPGFYSDQSSLSKVLSECWSLATLSQAPSWSQSNKKKLGLDIQQKIVNLKCGIIIRVKNCDRLNTCYLNRNGYLVKKQRKICQKPIERNFE